MRRPQQGGRAVALLNDNVIRAGHGQDPSRSSLVHVMIVGTAADPTSVLDVSASTRFNQGVNVEMRFTVLIAPRCTMSKYTIHITRFATSTITVKDPS